MAYSPRPAGPKNLREFFHWCWKEFGNVGGSIGTEMPTDPPEPVPPPAPGAHSHYLENLINVGIPSKNHRDSLSYEESTGYWEAERRTTTHIQETTPLDNESSVGDLWVVTIPPAIF
jgi:hypothetical protein